MTYLNVFLLTQNVHHRETVVESKPDEEAAKTKLPKASSECRCDTCKDGQDLCWKHFKFEIYVFLVLTSHKTHQITSS